MSRVSRKPEASRSLEAVSRILRSQGYTVRVEVPGRVVRVLSVADAEGEVWCGCVVTCLGGDRHQLVCDDGRQRVLRGAVAAAEWVADAAMPWADERRSA